MSTVTPYRELTKKLWEAYRQTPIMPASICEPRRGSLRGAIGAYASVVHLEDTISHHTSQGYSQHSPIMMTFLQRLSHQKALLEHHEKILYGAN